MAKLGVGLADVRHEVAMRPSNRDSAEIAETENLWLCGDYLFDVIGTMDGTAAARPPARLTQTSSPTTLLGSKQKRSSRR